MADEEERYGASSRGAGEEVVVLTGSTYAAAPEPDEEFQQEHKPSTTMFMSHYFVFPPHEHEDLPIEADLGEIHNQTECLDESNESSSEAELSIHSMGFQEGQTSSFFAETYSGKMNPPDENDISETHGSSNKHYGMPPSSAELAKTNDENGGSGLSGDAWWKRHVMSLYKQAKETNSFWSIFIAAAFMGLVVIGQQWQREKSQLQQLKWQFSHTNERVSRLLGSSVNRFKDSFVGSHQHRSLIHGAAAANI